MSNIFGSGPPKITDTSGLNPVTFNYSLVLENRSIPVAPMNDDKLTGSRKYNTKGTHWEFRIRDLLFKYSPDYSQFNDISDHYHKEVWLYQHNDGEPFKDLAGDPVPFVLLEAQVGTIDKQLVEGTTSDGLGDYIDLTFVSTEYISFYSSFFPVSQQLWRNEEGDNTLSTSVGTPITLTAIDTVNNRITLSWVPNVETLFDPGVSPSGTTPGWALMAAEVKNMSPSTADPSTSGDYADIMLITGGSYSTKTLNYTIPRGSESNFAVGDKLVLYNAYRGKWTWPDANPIVNSGTGWRSTYVAPGGTFLHSDGSLRLLVNGYSTGYEIGYFKSDGNDWETFTVQNSDAAIFTASGTGDWRDNYIFSGGSVLYIESEDKYICYVSGHNGSKWAIGYVKFTEDFGSITYSSSEIIDSSGSSAGFANPSVILHNGLYRMLYTDRQASSSPVTGVWNVREAFSTSPEGPFVDSGNVIVAGHSGNDGSWHEGWSDNMHMFHYKNKLYALIAGTSRYSTSGSRANRVTGLFYYNENLSTPAWQEDKRSPVFINPFYGDDLWPGVDDWAWDHMGGYPSVIEHPTNGRLYLFFSSNGGTNTYKVGAIYLDIPAT